MGIKQRVQRWLGLPDTSVGMQKVQWDNSSKYVGNAIGAVSNNDVMSSNSVTLTIHQGLGGRAVVSSYYDRQRDQQNTTLYVISDEQDFVTELGRIAANEALKR
jgi:hypothetical protein